MSGRWIKEKRARSEWGRELVKRRWEKHRTEEARKIKPGELILPPPAWTFDKPLFEISLTNGQTGQVHHFQLFRSRTGRIDQYRIVQDGKEWKAAMGLTRFLRGLGAAMFGARAERAAR